MAWSPCTSVRLSLVAEYGWLTLHNTSRLKLTQAEVNHLFFAHNYPKTANKLFSSLCQRTPLHIAAGKGYEYTLLYLIEQGADVNIKDNDGVCTHMRHYKY